MSQTRAEFLSKLRIRLDDTDVDAPRWPDTELIAYLEESVGRYSKLMPRRREMQFVADGVITKYDAPTDLIDRQVQRIITRHGATSREVPTLQFRLRNNNRYYEVVDDQLSFAFLIPANDVVEVRYNAIHTLPDDDITVASIPTEDFDLIYLWAECLAWRRIGGNDAALSRWKEGSGKRDDGPLIPYHVLLERQYEKLSREKKAGGRILQLVRPISRNRATDRYPN